MPRRFSTSKPYTQQSKEKKQDLHCGFSDRYVKPVKKCEIHDWITLRDGHCRLCYSIELIGREPLDQDGDQYIGCTDKRIK